jgi:23S rRNA (adenine2503-C2)-methyltransferase
MIFLNKINSDTTILYIFLTKDGYKIESVFSKTHHGICVSSQIGCKIGCLFCASCKNGFIRNLSYEEMDFQFRYIYDEHEYIESLHYAGTGEPLLNIDLVKSTFEEWKKSVQDIFITTSVPCIKSLDCIIKLDFKRIFLSIHSFDFGIRKKLMPNSIDPSYIVDFLKNLDEEVKEEVYLAHLFINGINDRDSDINQLISISKLLKMPVYLMFYNKISKKVKYHTDFNKFNNAISLLKKNNIEFRVSSSARKDKIGGCGTLRVNRNILN